MNRLVRTPLLPLLVGTFVLFLVSSPVTQGRKTHDSPRGDVVRVVILYDSPPTCFLDQKTQNAPGFAVDLMEYIAAQESRHLEYVFERNLTAVVQTMVRRQGDIVPNMGVDEERRMLFNFSVPVETFPVSIIIREGADWPADTVIARTVGAARNGGTPSGRIRHA